MEKGPVHREVSQLHILMLHQHFAFEGAAPGRRFFEIGRRFVKQGHRVTVVTGNREIGLSLGRKMIGLLQKEGLAVVVFNSGYPPVKKDEGRAAAMLFARRAGRQGRRLPPPDLILASSPPLEMTAPAYTLSCFYEVPLLLEIRRMGAWHLYFKDNPLKQLFSPVRRTAMKAYGRAEAIITGGPGAALQAAQFTQPGKTVYVLPEDLEFDSLFQQFNRIVTEMFSAKNNLTAAAKEP